MSRRANDICFAGVVKALEDSGQLENTLIFITSDNGPMIEPCQML